MQEIDLNGRILIAQHEFSEHLPKNSLVLVWRISDKYYGIRLDDPSEFSVNDNLQSHGDMPIPNPCADRKILYGGDMALNPDGGILFYEPDMTFEYTGPEFQWIINEHIAFQPSSSGNQAIVDEILGGSGPKNFIFVKYGWLFEKDEIEEQVLNCEWKVIESDKKLIYELEAEEKFEYAEMCPEICFHPEKTN